MSTDAERPAIGAVVVATSEAPVAGAVDSLRAQRDVDLDLVVTGTVRDLGVRTAPDRNAGAAEVRGDHLLFLDGAATLPDPGALARLAAELGRDPRRGYVQPRITDLDTGITLRRWVPRLRASDPLRAGAAAGMAEEAVLIRRDAFDRAGGWPDRFGRFHEGTDLAWRLWDHGYTGHYAPHVTVHRPATHPPGRPALHRLNARNRVWLARRNLPAPLIALNVAPWTALALGKVRDPAALRAALAGLAAGFREDPRGRSPMRWSTVARLARAGRPPIC